MARALRRVALVAAWGSLVALASSACRPPVSEGDADLRDLPLVEVAPQLAPDSVGRGAGGVAGGARAAEASDDALVVFLTGDGGWAPLDRHVAAVLAAHGVAVVGLDSRAYLSTPRTPEEEAADVARIARRYMAHWHRTRLAIVGYSRGAEAAPFVAARLPDDLAGRLALVAMLAPSTMANFSFHWIDLVRDHHGPDDRPVV
ncbi:MAG TPA: alpha/beta fold hydrolase, partial [Gemmatimonadaceae bacterium]|nr:alpha/beta fold hydrolase [Gemmatimonadaceae bacterium]